MPYGELEQFLDRGSIRAWWGFSWRTFFGCAGGAIFGQQLGAALYGSGSTGMAVLSVVGAIVGLVVLLKRRGIVLARRLLVIGTFGLRVATKRTMVDGAQLGGRSHDAAPVSMQVRVGRSVAEADAVPGTTSDSDDVPTHFERVQVVGRSNGTHAPAHSHDAGPVEEQS